MTKQIAPDVEMRLVAICDLLVDQEYQRSLKVTRVKRNAKRFEPGAMKAVNVSLRSDGKMMVTDGQHTIEMARQLGYTHVPALVVKGSREDEARWFGIINGSGTEGVNTRQKHLAALVAGDDKAIAVQHLLDVYDITISTGGLRKGRTNAIGAISKYSASNPAALRSAMDSIANLWPNDDCAWSGIVLRGMFELAAGAYDMAVIQSKLRRRKATARQVMDIAGALQTAAGANGGGAAHAKTAILKASGIKLR